IDLSTMGMSMMSPTLTAWYKNYGSTSPVVMPFHTGASTEVGDYGNVAWNFNGWGAALEMKISQSLSGSFSYESGNQTTTVGGPDAKGRIGRRLDDDAGPGAPFLRRRGGRAHPGRGMGGSEAT